MIDRPFMTLEEFQAEMEKLNRWAQHGCSDGGCAIEPPRGMHTNGGCRCTPRDFSETLLHLAAELDRCVKYRRWDHPKLKPSEPNSDPGRSHGDSSSHE